MSEDNKRSKRMPQDFMEAATDFERSKMDEMRASRKVAWVIAGVQTGVATVAVAGILVSFLLHHDPEPTIVKVDNDTGAVSVLRSIKDTNDKYDAVMDKFWLADYVKLRENYDWQTISAQYDAVTLMSDSNVASQYQTLVKAKTSPLTVLADKGKISVNIVSISFIGDVAQVRFTTTKLSPSGQNSDGSPVQHWIATIAYHYDSAAMTSVERLTNPLGFKVLSYSVDPEVVK